MRYAKGKIGRVFLARFDDRDDFRRELVVLSRKEKIRSAVLVFLGALREGNLVTGPKKPVIPPQPNQLKFRDGWEVLGVGTIFSSRNNSPQLHLHASMGKKRKVLTGCVRDDSKVFLVVEAVIFELSGIKAAKELDPKSGINLLRIL